MSTNNKWGWVRSIRKHKSTVFLHLCDGSCFQKLQIVADVSIEEKGVCFGSSVSVSGEVVKSAYPGQDLELIAEDVVILGLCDPVVYPFKARTTHTSNYTRQYQHLRSRTNTFSSLLRVRNATTMAIHNYFQNLGYYFIHTPVLTTNDCEGAGEVFSVQPASSEWLKDINTEDEGKSQKYYFGSPTYTTVSGQLHLEAIACSMSKVYSFGPIFRAEYTDSKRHLSEFYMIEAEIAFVEHLGDILSIMENLFKLVTENVLSQCPDEIKHFDDRISKGHQKKLEKMLTNPFYRMSYREAIEVLSKNSNQFQYKVGWGLNLKKEHELFLVKYCNQVPVFITDFPAAIKPFYMKINQHDPDTVAAADLLVPDIGELCGGSLREEHENVLNERLQHLELSEKLKWYLELRQFGSVPHGGFGMGFERYLQCLLGINNIRDTIPFPRWTHHCSL